MPKLLRETPEAAAKSSSAALRRRPMSLVAELVRSHAVDNTVVVTFSNDRQRHITENWVYHMQQLGVGGLLVGMMNMAPSQPTYVKLAATLRAQGVGVYTVNSPEVKVQPQGGRWFHVLPLLRTGARLLLSDSDAVWLSAVCAVLSLSVPGAVRPQPRDRWTAAETALPTLPPDDIAAVVRWSPHSEAMVCKCSRAWVHTLAQSRCNSVRRGSSSISPSKHASLSICFPRVSSRHSSSVSTASSREHSPTR